MGIKCFPLLLRNSIGIQRESGAHEWHLFLTFKAVSSRSNQDAIDEIKVLIEDNLVNQSAKEAYGAKPMPSELIKKCYPEFLRIGVAKFLAYSATRKDYAIILDGCFFYRREPEEGGSYHIVKLVVGFKSIGSPEHIPNMTATNTAYQKVVPQIFKSIAVDVYAKLGLASERTAIRADLDPVLREPDHLKIID